MKIKIRAFDPKDEADVIPLWHKCGLVVSWNDPHQDIQRKLQIQPEMFLVGELDKQIVATVMAGYDGHRGWINYLAVHPDFRRTGLGRHMMAEAEKCLRVAGCLKVNLQVRSGNTTVIGFYKAIGFKPDDVVSLGKALGPE